MRVELADKHMETHGSTCRSQLFCAKHGLALLYDVQKETVKNIKKLLIIQYPPKSYFRAGSGTDALMLSKS